MSGRWPAIHIFYALVLRAKPLADLLSQKLVNYQVCHFPDVEGGENAAA